MSVLNLQEIESIVDIKTEIVDMKKEWGGDIKIKALNFAEQLDFEQQKAKLKDNSEIILLLLQYCIVTEDNKNMFNCDTVNILKNKSASSLYKVFNKCLDLNSFDQNSVDNNAKN